MIHAYTIAGDTVFCSIGTLGGNYFAFESSAFPPQPFGAEPDDCFGWFFAAALGDEWDRDKPELRGERLAETVDEFNALAGPFWDLDLDGVIFRGYYGDGGETSVPVADNGKVIGYIRFFCRTKGGYHHHTSAGTAVERWHGFGNITPPPS